MHIDIRSNEEEDNRQEHTQGWYPKTYAPANRVLDINHNSLSEQQNHGKCGVVPVEETVNSFFPIVGGWIELIHTKRNAAWPNATGADGQKPQPQQ